MKTVKPQLKYATEEKKREEGNEIIIMSFRLIIFTYFKRFVFRGDKYNTAPSFLGPLYQGEKRPLDSLQI